MPRQSFSSDWLTTFNDPYALLGISVAADDRRVLKRYRHIAKLLHPDSYINADDQLKDLASQLLARLVNPAYQKLKQEKNRADIMAILRLKARRIARDESPNPTSKLAQQLLSTPQVDVDVFYEQAIAQLADIQYSPLDQFETTTTQLAELNLLYLWIKSGEPVIREKRTGLVSANEAKPVQYARFSKESSPSTTSYAQRHYQRAQLYMKNENWSMAIQELRDAVKIEPQKSDYHALLAKAYLMQNLPGMAKVHFKQALKFEPTHAMALSYAKRLGIMEQTTSSPEPKHDPKTSSGGLFGLFARKR